MVSASTLPTLRAFRVLLGERLLGFVGDGDGPLETADGSRFPGPRGCRFRSAAAETERALLELVHAADGLDEIVARLRRAGLALEPASPEGLFADSWVASRWVVGP